MTWGARREGRGLWHKRRRVSPGNLRGTWLPSAKAQDCFLFCSVLSALHHSGHGSRHSKSQDYSYSARWGMAWVCQEAALARAG